MIEMSRNRWLLVGGALSALASGLHLAMIAGGAAWYRFFGAGEQIATLAARGHWYPPLIASVIALVLAVWALYAFSGAGLIRPLPLLKWALTAITAVYLLRGLALIPLLVRMGGGLSAFWWWSSLICLGYGAVHLIGLIKGWSKL